MTTRPIEIVGGGLAGLSLGLALRRDGVPVTLHEAGTYPRHRVCGEFISGLEPSTIDRLGLAPMLGDALHHSEVAWSVAGQPSRTQRLPSPALAISRYRLDVRFAEAFCVAGGVLHVRSRVSDVPAPGRVITTGRRRSREGRWIGLKVHVRGLELERDLEMHLGEQSYVGLTRVEDGATNVCGLFHQRPLRARGAELVLDYLRAAGLDKLASRLATAGMVESSFAAIAALSFDRRTHRSRGLHLGDACAAIPPFTGNGMAMAFQSAEIALGPLLAYARGEADWAATLRVTDAALRQRFRLRLATADALHPFLLRPRRQRWFAALGRARLLPFGPLYATLH